MGTRLRAFTIAATVLLSFGAVGQVKSVKSVESVSISGRLVDTSGKAIPDVIVNLREGEDPEYRKVASDDRGTFAFQATKGLLYELWVTTRPDDVPYLGVIREMEIADGKEITLGDIVLEYSLPGKPIVHLAGPFRIKAVRSTPALSANSPQRLNATTIAAVYIDCSGVSDEQCDSGTVHVVLSNGAEVRPPAVKLPIPWFPQEGGSSPLISEDRRAVGWLINYKNCCTSYPLPLKLVIYRLGKPLRTLDRDCPSAIWEWHFEAGGSQVATYSNFPHGDYSGCYELRDIETGRKLGTWYGDSTSKKPIWVKRFKESEE